MGMSKIDIKTNGMFAEIFVDGHQLMGVRGYELKQKAGKVPVLTLDLNALDATVDGQAIMFQQGYGEIEKIVFKENELSEDSPQD